MAIQQPAFLAEGSTGAAQWVGMESGEVISGQTAGRALDTDITIAKFVGIGAQDLVAAEVTLARLSIHGRC
jgi:ornithine cyclodeaminase/alanine dehydrogenase-like protein (mu-crystallin family)